MARDAVAVTDLSIDAGAAEAAGVAISPTNGATVAAGHTQELLLSIRNSLDSEKDVTISAGTGPRAALGDLVVACAAETSYLFALESARFVDDNGAVVVDFESGMTGTICAYRLPGNV